MYRLNRIWVVLAVFACSLGMAWSSGAGILGDGDVVLDTETGLEYLHSKYTWGNPPGVWMYPGSYTPYPWTPPTPPGYSPASDAQVRSLFAAVGLAPTFYNSQAAYTAIDTLHTYMGVLYEFTNGRYERTTEYISGSPTPDPFDSSLKLTGYNVRVDEDFFRTNRTGSIWETGGAVNGASQRAFLVMVRQTSTTPANAQAASSSGPSGQTFNAVSSGVGGWYGVSATPGMDLKITSDSQITSVGLPASFTDGDDLLMFEDPSLGTQTLAPGQVFELSSPVDMLTLTGYEPGVPALPLALSASESSLPLFVSLSDPDATLTVTNVPEPGTLALLGLGAMLIGRRRSMR